MGRPSRLNPQGTVILRIHVVIVGRAGHAGTIVGMNDTAASDRSAWTRWLDRIALFPLTRILVYVGGIGAVLWLLGLAAGGLRVVLGISTERTRPAVRGRSRVGGLPVHT